MKIRHLQFYATLYTQTTALGGLSVARIGCDATYCTTLQPTAAHTLQLECYVSQFRIAMFDIALSCRSFFAKEPLIIGLFCGK